MKLMKNDHRDTLIIRDAEATAQNNKVQFDLNQEDQQYNRESEATVN